MNKKQEFQLKYAAANLMRSDQEKNLQGMVMAHKEIKGIVTGIYKNKIGVPTVLQVERILNDGQANVLGKASETYKQTEMLDRQSETGLATYALFNKLPETYVQIAYASRMDVQKGKPFRNKIPYDPVRSALTEHREQLTKELTQRTGNPFQDSLDTNRMRFKATITAERDYLEKFLKHHDRETPEKKLEHLQDFDKKTVGLIRRVEPPARSETSPPTPSPSRER